MGTRSKTLALVTAASLTALAACGDGAGGTRNLGFEECEDAPMTCNSGDPVEGGSVAWGMDATWGGWNLYSADDGVAALYWALRPMAAGIGLGNWNQNEEFVYDDAILAGEPRLASEDPLTVEYPLNPEANWGDGQPITLDDWIYHWYATSADAERCDGCPIGDTWGTNVAAVEEPEDDLIQVTYEDGYTTPEWPYENAFFGTAPTHVLDDAGLGDWKTDPETMAETFDYFSTTVPEWSTGPFTIASAEVSDYVTYERNPDWAGGEGPYLDELTIRAYDEFDTLLTELKQGTLQGATPMNVSPEGIRNLESDAPGMGVKYHVSSGSAWGHIDFNMQGQYTSDQAFRQAVFYALDREELNGRVSGLVLDDVPPKGNHAFRNDSDYYVDHIGAAGQGEGDVDRAKRTLEDAGYTLEGDVLHTPDGEPVTLTFRFSNTSESSTYAEIAQSQLKDLGIEVETAVIPNNEFGDVLAERQFDMIHYGFGTTPLFTETPYDLWHSTGGSNYGGLDDPDVDAAVEKIRRTTDLDQAAEYANDAVRLVVDQAYQLPVGERAGVVIADEGLVNVRENWADTYRVLYNVHEWGWSELPEN
ncbi:ABC transporter substrate-binding protein [Salininema proteolyticum]|uniref:ABC transporter substrate-binding protein n=1 Tax=Salininema proteolyticum TaxID=1607685 RepID=A0ABV8U2W5_9ACTN